MTFPINKHVISFAPPFPGQAPVKRIMSRLVNHGLFAKMVARYQRPESNFVDVTGRLAGLSDGESALAIEQGRGRSWSSSYVYIQSSSLRKKNTRGTSLDRCRWLLF